MLLILSSGMGKSRIFPCLQVKFLDSEESLEEITRVVTATLANVKQNAAGRRILFSTFHPDAAMLLRRLQDEHPVRGPLIFSWQSFVVP